MTTPDILLDTSALIAFLRGDGTGHDARRILSRRCAVISAISVYELCAGVTSDTHRAQRIELVGLTRVVPVDGSIARRGADLFTALRRRGITVDNEDLIIAATALERDLAVLTENTRHFEMFPEVRLVVPEAPAAG
jgi:predicted nucleic acid-binding protein